MTTRALTDLLAKKARLRRSTAAEQVHRMVHDILRTLRRGEAATLPGLGRFEPGPTPKFYFDENIASLLQGGQQGEKIRDTNPERESEHAGQEPPK
jgi:hypothetical protein